MKQEEEERKQKQQRKALDQMNRHRLDMVCVKQPITYLKATQIEFSKQMYVQSHH